MKNKTAKLISKFNFKRLPGILKIYLLIALLAPVIANEKPLIINYNGNLHFPAFSSDPYFEIITKDGQKEKIRTETIDWKNLKSEFSIFAFIQWSPGQSDLENGNYASPFSKQFFINDRGEKVVLPFFQRHHLGTTRSGEDVLAGLIHGTRISLWIGFASMFIAGFFGVIIGGLAGYLGDYNLKTQRIFSVYFLLAVIPAYYYSFILPSDFVSTSFSLSIITGIISLLLTILLFFSIILWPLFLKIRFPGKNYFTESISIPVDFIIMRIIEIFLSLPRMVLILTIAAISRPSISTLILIIGFTSWTDIARITRAEVLKLREVDFILAEKSIGTRIKDILFKHILPNISPVIITVLIFGVASAILLETGLSFLGVGLPAGTVTWGTLMFAAKENFMAWWLVVFPGLAITVLLVTLNKYGKKLY